MSKVRNVSGEPLFVPELNRLVEADQVVDVPVDRLSAYLDQSATWADETPAKPATKKEI